MEKKKVVIFGAGITGLTAGWKLSEKGYDIEILEKKSNVGGLADNTKKWGISFDTTPHAFHAHSEICFKKFNRLMKDELVSYTKHVELKQKGKYVRYPLTPLNMFFSLNFFSAINCGFSLVYARLKNRIFNNLDDSSAESWIINRYGMPLYNLVFKDYTSKVWGVEPSKLATNFARLKIPNISFVDLFMRLFANPKKFFGHTYKDAPAIMELYYPKKGGIGRISDKLCEKIEKNGGKVHLNTKIEKINLKGNQVESVCYKRKDGSLKEVKADYYFSTIPIAILVEMIEKENSEVLLAARDLKYRDLIATHFLINKKRVFIPQSTYFPANTFFNRASDIQSFDRNFKPKDKTILTAEITCQKGDKYWNMDEKEFLNNVIQDLEREGVVKKKEIIDASLVKIPHAYPRYDIGYEKNIIKIINRFKEISNLLIGGRQGLFRYLDMDVCFETGLLIADKIEHNDFDFKKEETNIDSILLS